jgi:allantoicase
MSDGWETRRSQVGRGKYAKGGKCEGQERREWVVARLAGTGTVRWVEVDTAFHPGNYPVVSGCIMLLMEVYVNVE